MNAVEGGGHPRRSAAHICGLAGAGASLLDTRKIEASYLKRPLPSFARIYRTVRPCAMDTDYNPRTAILHAGAESLTGAFRRISLK